MLAMPLMLRDDPYSQHAVSGQREPEPFGPDKAEMYDAERAQRLLLEAALESVPLGVAIIDGQTLAVRWANRACRHQLGRLCRNEAIQGQRLSDIIPGAETAGLSEIVRRVALTGKPCSDLTFAFPARRDFARGESHDTIYARFALRKLGGADGEAGDVMLQVSEMTNQAGVRGRSRQPASNYPPRERSA